MTTLLPANVKVHLALGSIDMRKGIDGLAMLVQGVLHQDQQLPPLQEGGGLGNSL
jgi:transposase